MRRLAVLGAGLLLAAACTSTSPRSGALEPRYVAVHNTLAAMGLVEIGPIQRGALAEGRETRLAVELPNDCATIVAMGSADVKDLDLSVFDAEDKLLGKDTTTDAEAAVKICPAKGGKFTLVVKMTHGTGDFVVASWTGAPNGGAGSSAAALAISNGAGTCESPIPLPLGSSSNNTRKGEADHSGKCGTTDAKELVYRFELQKKQRFVVEVDPSFDSFIYLRRDDCEEKEAEVACNDDYQVGTAKHIAQARGSRLEEVLEPGIYYFFVDATGGDGGSFRMNAEFTDVPELADTCKQAKPLASHASGSITNAFDQLQGSCESGKGPEVPYRLDLPARARTRITMHSDDFSPVLHMRKTCVDDATELACNENGMKASEAAVVALLDPGTYTVFADSSEKGAHGRYTVDVDLTPDGGKGVRGDACGDAITIAPDDKLLVDGDTFEAKDDFAPKCAGAGAADMMYRFELAVRSRVIAKFEAEEGAHVFVLSKSCNDRTTETSCGTNLDEVLGPGVYWLGVDGTTATPFGRFQFKLRAKDVSLQDAACRAVPSIALGQTVTGTTSGAPDRFQASCGGRLDSQASGDRVFKLTLSTAQRVQLLLATPSHDGVLSIRKACLDPPGMRAVREVETACNNDGPDTRHSKIDTTLAPGTYYVVVDGHQGKNEGPFTLEAKALPTQAPIK